MQAAVHACSIAFGQGVVGAVTAPHHVVDLLLEMGETKAAMRLKQSAVDMQPLRSAPTVTLVASADASAGASAGASASGGQR